MQKIAKGHTAQGMRIVVVVQQTTALEQQLQVVLVHMVEHISMIVKNR